MKILVCGPENVAEFNAALREKCPAFRRLVGELMRAGLITGLRGARLTTGTAEEMAVLAEKDAEARTFLIPVCQTCDACDHWRRNDQGGRDGVGRCAVGAIPHKLKWPKQTACRLFSPKQEGES